MMLIHGNCGEKCSSATTDFRERGGLLPQNRTIFANFRTSKTIDGLKCFWWTMLIRLRVFINTLHGVTVTKDWISCGLATLFLNCMSQFVLFLTKFRSLLCLFRKLSTAILLILLLLLAPLLLLRVRVVCVVRVCRAQCQ